jgi:hypothetical protein
MFLICSELSIIVPCEGRTTADQNFAVSSHIADSILSPQ